MTVHARSQFSFTTVRARNLDSDGDDVCDQLEIEGCQDDTACNYDAEATDPGACFTQTLDSIVTAPRFDEDLNDNNAIEVGDVPLCWRILMHGELLGGHHRRWFCHRGRRLGLALCIWLRMSVTSAHGRDQRMEGPPQVLTPGELADEDRQLLQLAHKAAARAYAPSAPISGGEGRSG